MSEDAAAGRGSDVRARMHDQLAAIAAAREEQAGLRFRATAAGGSVEVTVDAGGQLVKTVVDRSYLDDHDFADVARFVTEAAQAAARDAAERVEQLWAPITGRYESIPSLPEFVEGLSDLDELMPPGFELAGATRRREEGASQRLAGGVGDDDDEAGFAVVRG